MSRQKGTETGVPSDALEEPIVVPFRGADEGACKQWASDVATARIAKLKLIAERYGINIDDPNAGLELALRIAIDNHPGFRIVYDDWQARTFHRLFGDTPFCPLKGRGPEHIGNRKIWGKDEFLDLLEPELLALLIAPAENRENKATDSKICETFVKAADPVMEKLKHGRERDSRTATLIRRLTKGRSIRSKNK